MTDDNRYICPQDSHICEKNGCSDPKDFYEKVWNKVLDNLQEFLENNEK